MRTTGAVLLSREYRTILEPPASLEDTSRYGNNGVFTDAPTWLQLPSGLWVLSFNGTSNHVTIATAPSLTFVGTILCWIYAIAANAYIFDNRAGGSVGYFAISAAPALLSSSGTLYIDGIAATAVTLGRWYFAGVTGITFTNLGALTYGRRTLAASWWNGYLAEPKIYNHNLTADQIYSVYQNERSLFGA